MSTVMTEERSGAFVSTIPESAATGPVADYYQQQREAWGFLPNYAVLFSHHPDVAQAWNALQGVLRGAVDRRLFELATVAAARALRSTYCTAAHSTFLRSICGDEVVLRSIAADPTGAGLEPRDRAVFEFAGKVAVDACRILRSDVDRLRALGYDDRDITGIVLAVAGRCFFTTVLDGLGSQLDREIAAKLSPELLESMVVGRPVATS